MIRIRYPVLKEANNALRLQLWHMERKTWDVFQDVELLEKGGNGLTTKWVGAQLSRLEQHRKTACLHKWAPGHECGREWNTGRKWQALLLCVKRRTHVRTDPSLRSLSHSSSSPCRKPRQAITSRDRQIRQSQTVACLLADSSLSSCSCQLFLSVWLHIDMCSPTLQATTVAHPEPILDDRKTDTWIPRLLLPGGTKKITGLPLGSLQEQARWSCCLMRMVIWNLRLYTHTGAVEIHTAYCNHVFLIFLVKLQFFQSRGARDCARVFLSFFYFRLRLPQAYQLWMKTWRSFWRPRWGSKPLTLNAGEYGRRNMYGTHRNTYKKKYEDIRRLWMVDRVDSCGTENSKANPKKAKKKKDKGEKGEAAEEG